MNQSQEKIKKILFVVTQGEWGGAQRYLYDLATSPEAQKCDISVAIGQTGKNPLGDKLTAAGVKIWPLQHLKRPIAPISDFMAIFELARLYRQLQPDTIHLNSSKAGIVGSLASFIVRHPLFAICHKLIYTAHGWVFNEPLGPLKKRLYLFLEKFTARFKNVIICVSEFDRRVAIENKIAPAEKLVTIHNGINFDSIIFLQKEEALKELNSKIQARSSTQIQSPNFVIGTIANFYPTKGLSYLIEAFQIINEVHKLQTTNYQLIIIGDGELRPQLEQQINSAGLGKNILLVGSRENASKYLKAFDLYVSSSVKEGLPYSILEAMAAQLPIVATSVGGVPEMIVDNQTGLLAETKNAKSLAEKIKLMVNNKELRERLAQNTQDKMKQFSKDKMTRESFAQY